MPNLINLPPFISHLKRNLKVLPPEKKIKPFYCTTSTIAPIIKGFHLVGMYYSILKINVSRHIPACRALLFHSFISQGKDIEKL